MADEKNKSGAVRVEDYEAEEYLETLEPLSHKLQEQFPAAKFDRKSLGQLVGQIRQLQEDALGIKSLPPRPFPKIPSKLFQDLSLEGSLWLIVTKCHEAMGARGLKRVDFTNPLHRAQFKDILAQVMHELIKQGFLKWPKVFVHPSCGPEVPLLQKLVTELRGEVATSADAPGVTHHVHPFGPRGDPDDGIQYMRNLGRRGDRALVHWWYWPDSYDEYVPAESASDVLEPDKTIEGPWKVYARWLKDSAKFNEWMNPIDYEMEDAAAASKDSIAEAGAAVVPETVKRKRENVAEATGRTVASTATLLAAPPAPVPVRLPEVAPLGAVEVAPGLVRQRVLQPDPKSANVSAPGLNLSQSQNATGKPPPTTGSKAAKMELYRVPAHASWFKYDAIHSLEVKGCPAFFGTAPGAKRDPKVYKEIRNLVINMYREDVTRRLTFSDARQCISADAEAAQQVWAFLDAWGIINYHATDSPAETDATPLQIEAAGPPPSLRVTSAAAMTDAEALFRTRPLPGVQQGLTAAAGGAKTLALVTRRDVYGRLPSEAPVREARFFCNAMPWVECTPLRYHCTKIPDVDLCPEAFADGRLPPGCTAADFIRIDQCEMQATGENVWTDQDTLLLLEGLELYGDNWAEVADHVGTKSQVQCITHFLRLPIEDEFLDHVEDPPRGGHTLPPEANPQSSHASAATCAPDDDASGAEPIPFADQGNPVLAQIAFLAAMVGPKVAAAAAQRALEVLTEDDPDLAAEADTVMADDGQATAGSNGHATGGDMPPSTAKVKAAAATALAAAAVKARLLADEEEKQVQELMQRAVTAQSKLVEQHLQRFEHLQQALSQERTSLAAQREAATVERVKLQQTKLHFMAAAAKTLQPQQQQRRPPQQAAGQQPVPSVVPQQSQAAVSLAPAQIPLQQQQPPPSAQQSTQQAAQ